LAAHYSIVDVLRSLPTPHRNFLFDKFAGQMPETRLVERKLEKLAALVGPRDVKYYTDLYQHKGGLLTWYVFRDSQLTDVKGRERDVNTKRVEQVLKEEYAGIEDGLEPDLEIGGDPEPYHLHRKRGVLILNLAARDATREYVANWKLKTIHYDRKYVIALRDNPFTIEIRSAYGQVNNVYKVVSGAIGVRLDDGIVCTFRTASKRAALKKRLDSRCFAAQHRHDDTEVAKTSIEAQPDYDLESGKRLTDIEKVGVTGFSRSYEFTFEHMQDGYEEVCVYRVKLENGQIRVENDISEPALKVLQENVVALF
jgi:hypothetical protein